ncbi:bile acid:sodium symporter family protein [Nitratireductor soli]|uniref:bile acid:sodium symporter family protein n=1 Tax=Nitratireductor soli TaxID=1670619 RepID=UPI00065E0B51|nr:bile acid:sodium symporter family protein [Nitratireductor soli]
MEPGLAINVGLPVALVIIMLGLGLSLRIEDFLQVIAKPRPLIIGLCCQIVLLPLLCFVLLTVSGLPVSISVGMMLLAASPAGTTAALYTHLARGDVALSLAFAAVTSVLAMFSLPIIANLSVAHFLGEQRAVGLQAMQVLQIFAIALVPAIVGAVIRSRRAELARRLDRPVKLLASLFLALVIVFALVSHWDLLLKWGPAIGTTVLIFNVLSLAIGYVVPKMLGVAQPQAVALAMSIGIHNAALVITIALSEFMLNDSQMAIPPGLYGVMSYLTCAAFVWLLNRRPVQSSN